MNTIYRLVWNAARGMWVAASEMAPTRGKNARGRLHVRQRKRRFTPSAIAAVLALPGAAFANNAVFFNEYADGGCVTIRDPQADIYYMASNANCVSDDKASQTDRALFYGLDPGTTGSSTAHSTSLTLGRELYVNGGRIVLNNQVTGTKSLAIGNEATFANNRDAIAIGNGAVTSHNDSIALGSQSVTGRGALANYVDATGMLGGQNSFGELSVGTAGKARQVTNVAAGTQGTDAVNVDQLMAVAAATAGDSLQWDPAANAYSANHHGAGPSKIVNVAAGNLAAASTDAVNGSQLYTTNQQVEQNTTSINRFQTDLNTLADTPILFAGNSGSVSRKLGDTFNIVGGATTPGTYSGGNLQTVIGADGQLQLQMAEAPKFGSVVVNDRGSGRISGVAAGTDDQDAVNVGQLRELTNAAVANVVTYDDDSHDSVTLGGDTYDSTTGTGGTRIRNLARGVDDGDAVNMSQLNETDARIDDVYQHGTRYFHANSTGTDSVASGLDAVAIGMGAVASHDGSVALGAGSLADGSNLGHQAYLLGGSASGEVNIGSRRLSGLEAGADDTDAVNVAQLKAAANAAVANAVTYDNDAHDSVTLGGTTYDSATGTGGTRIRNLARGEDDGDAVNMSQLNETNTSIANLNSTINNIYGGGIKYFHTNSTGADSQATGNDAVAIGMGAVAVADNSVALGAGSQANRGANVGYYDGTNTLWDQVSVGEVSVGAAGAERQITNVAAGSAGTDAVNVNQLNAALQSYRGNSDVVGGPAMFVTSDDYALAPQAQGAQSAAGGANAVASGNQSTALGDNATASGNNSVALGYGSNDGGRDNVVSVGSAGAERKIINVAPAELSATSTEAVNGSQLHATNQRVDQLGAVLTDVRNDVNQLDRTLSGGVAAAMASAGLPQAYRPGASMMAVAMGTWNGQQALALGGSRITDNGRYILKGSANATTSGRYGGTVGVGFQW